MRLLLDTHAFLWWVDGNPALGPKSGAAISNPENEVLVSIASCWEMAIKMSLGKLRLTRSLAPFISEQLTVNGFSLLNVSLKHIGRVADLPFHHRDPFDRLLAAQALEEKLTVVSSDRSFRKYGVARLW
jgi:PIN domain nuclease of toxin-antitoxin system